MLTSLDKLLDRLGLLFKWLATVCLLVMVALNMVNVNLAGDVGSCPGLGLSMDASVVRLDAFLRLLAIVRQKRDVVVDILMVRLPKPLRIAGGLFACAIGMLFMIAILRAAPRPYRPPECQYGHDRSADLDRSAPLFLSAIMVFLHMCSDFILIALGQVVPFRESAALEAMDEAS